jgi:hypothetical protein
MFASGFQSVPPRGQDSLYDPLILGQISLDNSTALSVNIDTSKSNHSITLSQATIINETGRTIYNVTSFYPAIIPPKSNTTVRFYLNNAAFYQQCFYRLCLKTENRSIFCSDYFSGLTTGNFNNASDQMVIKQVIYNSTLNNVIIKCDRIYSKAVFYFAVVSKPREPPIIVLPPSRYDLSQENETIFKINFDERLPPGQYSLVGVNPRGLIVDFNVP